MLTTLKTARAILFALAAALFIGACGAAYQPEAAPAGSQGMGPGMMGGGMMNGGMMNGGMMGGMMGHGGMMAGMMGGAQTAPTAAPTPLGATPAPVDRELSLSIDGLKFGESRIAVKPGETIRFVISNNDPVAHNFVGQQAGIPYLPLPPKTTQTLTWTAPAAAETYEVMCTLHPGMRIELDVQP